MNAISDPKRPEGGQIDVASPIIAVEAVDKWFGDFQALKSVNLQAATGERLVICGPSGSGKSTLIRCINRLEAHDAGRITVDGIELDDNTRNIAAIRAEVGMVFQQFNLFPHLTVLQNLMLAPRRVRGASQRKRAPRPCRTWSASAFPNRPANTPPNSLAGSQQRVAIARALVHGGRRSCSSTNRPALSIQR